MLPRRQLARRRPPSSPGRLRLVTCPSPQRRAPLPRPQPRSPRAHSCYPHVEPLARSQSSSSHREAAAQHGSLASLRFLASRSGCSRTVPPVPSYPLLTPLQRAPASSRRPDKSRHGESADTRTPAAASSPRSSRPPLLLPFLARTPARLATMLVRPDLAGLTDSEIKGHEQIMRTGAPFRPSPPRRPTPRSTRLTFSSTCSREE